MIKNHSLKSKKKESARSDHWWKSKLYIPHQTNNKNMQNSLQQVNSISRPITTSSITTVQSLHKNQTRIWMHNIGSHHLPKKPHEATWRSPKRCLISNSLNNRVRDGKNTNLPKDWRVPKTWSYKTIPKSSIIPKPQYKKLWFNQL